MEMFHLFTTVTLLLASFDISLCQRKVSRNVALGGEVKTVANFNCPEEFGYYPHPNDCTQYYVCVFGGALLESCTGGLMYSHELQTCDWPRNVGCDGAEISGPVAATSASPPSSRTREESRTRYTPPTPPPAQPAAIVTSRGQPRQLQHNQQEIIKQRQQQQLYADAEETLPPAEEVESDRQQRVYRGQPSTIGQVQKDRDGLRHSNAIPTYSGRSERIGVISFGTQQQQQQQQPQQQYRVDTSSTAPVQPSAISTATATARALYNSSQYNSNNYDPYYALYDDDVELYRDDDYSQQYNNNNNNAAQSQTPHYRRTPSPAIQSTQEEAPKRGNSGYIQNNYNNYQPNSNSDYNDDNSYNSQVEDQNAYRQVNRQPTRGDRNDLNYLEEASTKRTITTTTTRKTTTRTTTLRTFPPKKSTFARTSTRGRGSTHYANGGNIVNNEVTVTVNRGTPASRPRPTLKPSTSIVSKASEFIDIYRYPPSRPAPIYPQPQPDKTAAKCRKDVCLLPDCSCGGKEIPGDLPVEQVPQLVLLTFDDSVNDLNKGLYSDLFEKGRTNPNGCPIAATFYVSHEWTDYSQVQNLYSDGHEIASHTVSHSFGEQFSQKKWTREVAGQREILSAYGGVHLEDVRGMRAPFLSVGGNKMFKMLYDSNFTYDSSMPIYENKPPSWPYTLDYKLFHDCMIPPCPTRSYPGVWEVPMVMWQDLNGGRCSMGDACSNPPDAEGVFKMLTKNFQRHYTTNRAPFGLFYHAAWFTQPHHKEGFINFLDSILEMKDVWLVTNWQAIQWVRDPTPASRLNSFQPFQCDFSNRPKRCNNPKVCNLWHKSGVRYMRTCQPCPDIYPWTGNTGIRSSRIDNDIED
nr:PREDICTED: chitin deacetylase 5 isoform X6 [Tribolium castaneum]|eukprot:XP_015837933.1 PREDICTED: chitin deacetylase 5 isoform X6 [Tribolium castaneum]